MSKVLKDSIQKTILQGRACADEYGYCSFRSSDLRQKCAVGQLIPNKKYDVKIEGLSIKKLFAKGLMYKKYGKLTAKKDFQLQTLQDAHDCANHDPNYFVEDFIDTIRGSVADGDLPEICLTYIEEVQCH